MILSRLVRCAVMAAWTLVLATSSPASTADPRVATLTHRFFVLSDAPTPPSLANAQPIILPDDWAVARPSAIGSGWYVMEWTPPANRARICAVYLTTATMPVEVYGNGHLIGATGALTGSRPRSWQQAKLFVIPTQIMRTGANSIELRVYETMPGAGGLGPVLAGPEPALRERAFRDLLLHTLGRWWSR